jgi:large subunit ribosomal protein L30
MPLKKIKIQLVRSPVGYIPKIRRTIRALGFKKVYQIKEHNLTAQVQGMINKVPSLLKVLEE